MSVRDGLEVTLDGRGFLLEVEEFEFASVDPTRQGADTGAGASEASLSNEVVWRRVRENWVGGAGQELADLADDQDPSSPIRFFTSTDIDASTRGELTVARPRLWLSHQDRDVGDYQLDHADLTNLGSTEFWLWVDIPPNDYRASAQTVLVSNSAFELSIGNQAVPSDLYLNLAIKLSGSGVFTNVQSDAFADPNQFLAQGGTVGVYVRQSGGNALVDFHYAGFGGINQDATPALTLLSAESVAGTINVAGGTTLAVFSTGGVGFAYGTGLTTAYSTTGATAYAWVDISWGAGWLASNTISSNGGLIRESSGFAGMTVTTTAIAGTRAFIFPQVAVWNSYDYSNPDDLIYGIMVAAGRRVRAYTVNQATGALTEYVGSAFHLPSPVASASSDGAGTVYMTLESGKVWAYSTFNLSLDCAQLGTETAEGVAVCDGRLLAWLDQNLFELSSTGVRTNIMSATSTSFRWGGAIAAPNGLYAWGAIGVAGAIYYLPISDVDGSVDPGFMATPMPSDERVNTILSHLGVLVVGTTQGLRLAVINNDATLALGPVLELGSIVSLTAIGTDVYALNSDGKLWRVDPARFTDDLQPAYMAVGEQVDSVPAYTATHVNAAAHQVVVLSTTPTDALLLLTSQAFIYGYPPQTAGAVTRVADEGTIDLGWFTFGIGEQLALDSITVECEATPVASTHLVQVDVDTPAANAVLTGSYEPSGTGVHTVRNTGTDLRAERFRVRLTLTADPTKGTAPVVKRVTLRAVPAPEIVSDAMLLPLVLRDTVTSDVDENVELDVLAEFLHLVSLRESRKPVTLTIGSWSKTVRVEGLVIRSGGLGGGNGLDGYDERGRWLAGTWNVRIVTLD